MRTPLRLLDSINCFARLYFERSFRHSGFVGAFRVKTLTLVVDYIWVGQVQRLLASRADSHIYASFIRGILLLVITASLLSELLTVLSSDNVLYHVKCTP